MTMAPALIAVAGSRKLAFPLGCVIETMRPLPVVPLVGVPSFVLGAAVIRGAPVPVVDLSAFVGKPGGRHQRFVTLRVGDRTMAVAVEAVVEVRELDPSRLDAAPPVLREGIGGAIEAIGTIDAELVIVLNAMRILPDEVWRELGSHSSLSAPRTER